MGEIVISFIISNLLLWLLYNVRGSWIILLPIRVMCYHEGTIETSLLCLLDVSGVFSCVYGCFLS